MKSKVNKLVQEQANIIRMKEMGFNEKEIQKVSQTKSRQPFQRANKKQGQMRMVRGKK